MPAGERIVDLGSTVWMDKVQLGGDEAADVPSQILATRRYPTDGRRLIASCQRADVFPPA